MSLHALLMPEQVKAIEEAPLVADQRHPAWSALFLHQTSATDFLTRRAADAVWRSPTLKVDMRSVLQRAADLENIADAAAALAELRALGAMIEARMSPVPLPASAKHGPSPDFEANAGDGPVTVEVHAKHEDGAQTARRLAIAAGEDVPGVERTSRKVGDMLVTHTTSVWHPGGTPDPKKPFDSIQANVISKLCSVKASEHQRREAVPSVLWLDLTTFDPMSKGQLLQTLPLVSGHIGLTSGAIWHAFYGWKGAPLLEEGNPRRTTMGHDGRFRMSGDAKSHLAAAIVSFERGLVLLENPWATVPLPPIFRRRCEGLAWFKLGNSVADWTPGQAAAQLALAVAQIEALAGQAAIR